MPSGSITQNKGGAELVLFSENNFTDQLDGVQSVNYHVGQTLDLQKYTLIQLQFIWTSTSGSNAIIHFQESYDSINFYDISSTFTVSTGALPRFKNMLYGYNGKSLAYSTAGIAPGGTADTYASFDSSGYNGNPLPPYGRFVFACINSASQGFDYRVLGWNGL